MTQFLSVINCAERNVSGSCLYPLANLIGGDAKHLCDVAGLGTELGEVASARGELPVVARQWPRRLPDCPYVPLNSAQGQSPVQDRLYGFRCQRRCRGWVALQQSADFQASGLSRVIGALVSRAAHHSMLVTRALRRTKVAAGLI
jgi:hypothetical protein